MASTDERTRLLEREAYGNGVDVERLKHEWLRSLEWRSCYACGAQVPLPTWEEHRAEHLAERPWRDSGGRLVDEPLYDRIVLRADPHRSTHEFLGDCARKSSWESSNMTFAGGPCLPAGHDYYLSGVSLVPDAGPSEAALDLWNEGYLEFGGAGTVVGRWPCREIMDDPQDWPGTKAGTLENLRSRGPVRHVTVSDRPVHILSFVHIYARLECPGLPENLGVMFVMHGLMNVAYGDHDGVLGANQRMILCRECGRRFSLEETHDGEAAAHWRCPNCQSPNLDVGPVDGPRTRARRRPE